MAAYRGGEVSWEELLRTPEVFKLDATGPKAWSPG
jgi:hypothetical protein